jgi:hypothetical protein
LTSAAETAQAEMLNSTAALIRMRDKMCLLVGVTVQVLTRLLA